MSVRTTVSRIRLPLLLLGLVEVGILYSSIYVAALLLYGDLAASEVALAPSASLMSIVMLICLISMGLYQFHQRLYFREALARVVVAISVGSLTLAVVFYLLPSVMVSRKMAAVAVPYLVCLLLLVRYFFVRHVDENIFRVRTLVYGAGNRAASLSDLRRRADRRGFKLLGMIPAPGDAQIADTSHLLDRDGTLLEMARELQADEIVIAMDDRRGNLPVKELLDCRLRGIEVIELLEFLERETGRIWVDLVNPGWLVFSAGFHITRLSRVLKRLFDALIGAIALLIAGPVMLLCALAIKLEDGLRAPVFYRQRRVGYLGEDFAVLKFRSMIENAEQDGQAVWAEKNDARVTRVGSFLRKCRLDELPQILNVLSGSMSLVGPRPERPAFVSQLSESIPYYNERHTVKPGITGWAQLRYAYGSSEDDAIAKLEFDLYYIKHSNLLLDLVILIQTVEVVLWGKGAR